MLSMQNGGQNNGYTIKKVQESNSSNGTMQSGSSS